MLFYYQNNNSLDGILITHVDDFCWGGTENFRDSTIRSLKNIFPIGTESEQSFRYLGLNITQKQNFNITVDQIQLIHEIKSVEIPRERLKNKSDPLNENELKSYWTLTGQLSWIANQSHPDITFAIYELSSAINNATINHLIQAIKVLLSIRKLF